MFIEFQTKDDKTIFYNVNDLVFIGEMDENVSVMFDDGTHAILPDEYAEVVKKVIGLSKTIIDPSLYVQFSTKKEERIAFPIRRVFYILEKDIGTAVMFNDGTRIELLDDCDDVIKRISAKLGIEIEFTKIPEETKS